MVAHSLGVLLLTKSLRSHVKMLPIHSIVCAAIGKTEWVRGDWLKPGCIVIDVGINSKPDASRKAGYRLVGDVNFDEAKEVTYNCALYTLLPVRVTKQRYAPMLHFT